MKKSCSLIHIIHMNAVDGYKSSDISFTPDDVINDEMENIEPTKTDISIYNEIESVFQELPNSENVLLSLQRLYKLLECVKEPIDELVKSNDGYNIIMECGLCPLTNVCYYTLKVFLKFISLKTYSVLEFLARNISRFLPLIRSPDLHIQIITILIFVIDEMPQLTDFLVIEKRLVVQIAEFINLINTPKSIGILLILIDELLKRTNIKMISQEMFNDMESILKTILLNKFTKLDQTQGEKERCNFFTKDMIIPLLRVYDLCLKLWPENNNDFLSEDIINKILFLTFHPYIFGNSSGYSDILRVWNRILLIMQDRFVEPKLLIEFLLNNLDYFKSLKLDVLFLLSNFAFYQQFDGIFFELNAIKIIREKNSVFSIAEKENATIIILNLMNNYPEFSIKYLKDDLENFINDSFDLMQATKEPGYPCLFISIVWKIYDINPEIKNLIDTDSAIETLEDLTMRNDSATANAAREMLNIFFENNN